MGSGHFLKKSTELPVPAQEAFQFHERDGAFERLVAPWRPVALISKTNGIRNGSTVTIAVPVGPLRLPWIFEHSGYIEDKKFEDTQISGPFKKWHHVHQFLDNPELGQSLLEDSVEYELPLGPAGDKFQQYFLAYELDRLFRFRHNVTIHDLGVHARYSDRPRKKFIVAGSSGLIGSNLCPFLTSAGHSVTKLVRSASSPVENLHTWSPVQGRLSPTSLSGFDCVVNLGGSNIAASRWSTSTKRKIIESRISGTRLLSETLARMPNPPKTFICASAIGFYGAHVEGELNEQSPSGTSFLAEVVRAWEDATKPAIDAGVRVVHLRLGVVLSPRGGVLNKMWLPFLLGVGGPMGSGQQFVSWISIHDVLAAIEHITFTDSLSGPVNLTSPIPVTNEELSREFASALNRPCALRVRELALRTIFGQMADETVLSNVRVNPTRLQDSGFVFSLPKVRDAIRMDLGVAGDRV